MTFVEIYKRNGCDRVCKLRCKFAQQVVKFDRNTFCRVKGFLEIAIFRQEMQCLLIGNNYSKTLDVARLSKNSFAISLASYIQLTKCRIASGFNFSRSMKGSFVDETKSKIVSYPMAVLSSEKEIVSSFRSSIS